MTFKLHINEMIIPIYITTCFTLCLANNKTKYDKNHNKIIKSITLQDTFRTITVTTVIIFILIFKMLLKFIDIVVNYNCSSP
ncbi:TPA: hypothetical protein JD254_03555 [Proteus mirabilis]|nr:hypothetical protein [Proteus mirabilis]HAU5578818.1 hypothetical protein [Proteus mirabilis]HAU5582319.1 hypothetical protein [Proteus mirabilis]